MEEANPAWVCTSTSEVRTAKHPMVKAKLHYFATSSAISPECMIFKATVAAVVLDLRCAVTANDANFTASRATDSPSGSSKKCCPCQSLGCLDSS